LKSNLKEWVLLLLLQSVGTEYLQTTLRLLGSETLIVTLEECEDILDNYCLEVDLFLVIEVIGLKFDLCRMQRESESCMRVTPLGRKEMNRTLDISILASAKWRSSPKIDAKAQGEKRTSRFVFLIVAKLLVFSHPLLIYGRFLDRRIRASRRPGFLFYIWLRHDHRGSQCPEGEIRGWRVPQGEP
jgi:hypothetical protein